MTRFWIAATLAVVQLVASACSTPQEPDPTFDIAPAQIESVEVAIAESFPAQATAHVRGFLGDGCSELLPIEQSRAGDEIVVTIQRSRPVGVACIQIVTAFDEVVPLRGTYTPGRYRLTVNDVVITFQVD